MPNGQHNQDNPAGPFDPATGGRTVEPVSFPECDPDTNRKRQAGLYRATEADRACDRDLEPVRNRNNGEEWDLTNPDNPSERLYAANFTKRVPHNQIGEVIAATDDPRKAYLRLLKAVNTTDPDDFAAIPNGPNDRPQRPIRQFVDPQSGIAFDLEGPDAASAAAVVPDETTTPPSLRVRRITETPRFEEARIAAGVGEVYLMALLRDVPLNQFVEGSSDPRIQDAARLINQFSDYRGPVDSQTNAVTPQTLFRGGNVLSRPPDEDQSQNVGELVGPYLSQFQLIGSRLDDSFPPQFPGGGGRSSQGFQLSRADGQVLYGTLTIDQRQIEVEEDLDFMTDYQTWLSIQQGIEPAEASRYTGERRFLHSLRQMAEYVHRDQTYQEGLVAALLIISMFERAERKPELGPLFNPGNPYLDSGNQMGFGTFGNGHILALLAEATTRAIKAAWYQKWYNHRWLRPETLGGRIHNVRTDAVEEERYDINREITGLGGTVPGAEIMELVRLHNKQQNQDEGRPTGDSFLLPQQYPEGSPTHPSYPAGHATQIAAEVTVLKGLFNGRFVITDLIGTPDGDPALVPNDDGTALVNFTGPDGLGIELFLEEELNKLAANVALSRSLASVHYRIDYAESMLLGEYVGLGLLQEQARSFNNEDFFFELLLFSGIRVRILSDGEIVVVESPS